MKVNLIGVQDMNFTSREGNDIDGVKVFIAYPDSNTYGNYAESKFISRNVYNSFNVPVSDLLEKIGQVIDCEFDPKKKVVGITI